MKINDTGPADRCGGHAWSQLLYVCVAIAAGLMVPTPDVGGHPTAASGRCT
jgi:hypothetical protein